MYANYRGEAYAAASGHAPPLRQDLAVAYQQPTGYPPPNQQRQQQQQQQQQQLYGNTSSAPTAPYAPALTQYYGAQQRA